MFSGKARKAQEAVQGLDFSQTARDASNYALGQLRELGLGSELSAMAFDPVQSLLAVGTAEGRLLVFGGPAVEISWDVGRPVKIRHLAWRAGSGFLGVVDSKDTLSVYDLGRLDKGRPFRDSSLSMRSNITCLESHPLLPFLFAGGKDGTVDVYDLDRGCLAREARVPNLWYAQEEILRRSGVQIERRHIPVCIDVKIHPTDLNLLLVAYEGGVSLWNIAEQRAELNWEFIIPPGAPGGGNDSEEVLFSERRPVVTCVAWRPDGLVFAVGHEDGCISFASVADELAIDIRTIERASVNKTTEEDLFGWQGQGEGQKKLSGREPVFKLAWSGFPEETMLSRAAAAWSGAGGSAPTSPDPTSSTFSPSLGSSTAPSPGTTILTILGGLLPSDPPGIHLLEFPAYAAPTLAPTTTSKGNIPAPTRDALKSSLIPLSHHLYPTSTPPEDFLPLPRNSPYYSNAYDPTALIITTGTNPRYPVLPSAQATRGIEAWSFPPSLSHAPISLRLPGSLAWAGGGTCTSIECINIPTLSYRRMLHQFDMEDEMGDRLPLRGGKAWPERRPSRQGLTPPVDNMPRILVSSHVDLTVRFWDVSSHLLLAPKAAPGSAPLDSKLSKEFPRPLRHLDWCLGDVLRDQRSSGLEAARLWRERPWELEIEKVSLAEETMELAVMLSTGDIIISRLGYGDKRDPLSVEYARAGAEDDLHDNVNSALESLSLDGPDPSAPPAPILPPPSSKSPSLSSHSRRFSTRRRSSSTATGASPSHDLELQDHYIDLSLIPSPRPFHDGWRAVGGFIFPSSPSATSKTCLELSDIGFLAASSENSLIVADMRGPEVLLVDTPGRATEGGKGKGKARSDSSAITSLKWTISPISEDHDHNPRLIVVQASGLTRVFELASVGGTWHLSDSISSFSHDSVASSFATFVLDKHGRELLASPANLQLALAHQSNFESRDGIEGKGAFTSLWITVNSTTISAYFNIDGPRTAQYEGGQGFEKAEICYRNGAPVLMVQARNRQITAFSLPDLVQVARMTFDAAIHTSAGRISFSADGDLIQHIDPLRIRLYTTGDIARPAFPPRLEIWDPTIPVPWQTGLFGGVASTLSSFFGAGHGAAEIEGILGGPNRPPPKVRQRATAAAPPPQSSSASSTRTSTPRPRPRTQAVQADADSTVGIIAQTQQALAQRGEYLGYLQERLGSMADDAAKFASETKKSAQREAAKKTLASGWTSLWNK
ncbi:hypothetical protein BCR35DRAFT_307654 [Leucosporidium creatinivorum]|uniref:V-SNARE coiled-coil homology domain-containing protein n=1 Tax=Leucosporidium creatinivorum TaxID=106004 RepID=A0A1Y2EMC6_9BASI|nr:hypothetical protein BCR35DRAFT_307654 [Leucosporidium creatinivorum]